MMNRRGGGVKEHVDGKGKLNHETASDHRGIFAAYNRSVEDVNASCKINNIT